MDHNTAGQNVFRNRNFRLVFLGALVSELGAVLYNFAVSFYILEISNNNALLQGIYLALCSVTMLPFTLVGGVLGDRYHKAKIMSLCDYLKGGVILLATLFMVLFPNDRAHLVILFSAGILGNVIGGVFEPIAGSLLPSIVEESKLQQANSYFSLKSSLQNILGILLAGVLYAALPVSLLFAIVGMCYAASGVSEMFIRYSHVNKPGKLSVSVALGDIREGFRYMASRKAILSLMLSILFINFFWTPVSGNFLPYFIKTDVASAPAYLFSRYLTPEQWTSVFSVLMGVSSLAAAGILSAKPQKDKCGLNTALWLTGMAAAMLVLASAYWLLVRQGVSLNLFLILFCAGCLVLGFVLMNINIPIATTLQRIVDKDMLSKFQSMTSILSFSLIPLSSVICGAALQYMGSAALLFICAIGFTATALSMLFNRHVREV